MLRCFLKGQMEVIDADSSTFGVRLELPNSDYQLPSGLRCRVRFEINENDDAVK